MDPKRVLTRPPLDVLERAYLVNGARDQAWDIGSLAENLGERV